MKCVSCKKDIGGEYVTYNGDNLHSSCFKCAKCKTKLAGVKFTSKEDKPYCTECYADKFAQRCKKCKKPITDRSCATFEDDHFHNDCFNCTKCKSNLVGRGFHKDGKNLVCPGCVKN